jgi:DNA-binding PadR family transcriptional regulator
VEQGILTRADDPTHRQKAIYSLTEKGIELLPVLAEMAAWGVKYLPVTEELAIRAQLLKEGGQKLWAEFMDELREMHLGPQARLKPKPRGASIFERLQKAYEEVVARRGQPPVHRHDGKKQGLTPASGGFERRGEE